MCTYVYGDESWSIFPSSRMLYHYLKAINNNNERFKSLFFICYSVNMDEKCNLILIHHLNNSPNHVRNNMFNTISCYIKWTFSNYKIILRSNRK